jgi:hypothetical protein
MPNTWLYLSFSSVPLYAIAFIAITFFARNFGFGGVSYLFWSVLGTTAACALYLACSSNKGEGFVPERWYLALCALTVGAVVLFPANLLMYRALASNPPNPALPVAIMGCNAMLLYLAACGLGRVLPAYFKADSFSAARFAGITMIIVGSYLIKR